MTVAQAVNPMTDVPSEVRSLQIQHSTLEISPLITIITRWLITAWYGDLQAACSLIGREACVNCCVMCGWLVDLVRCCVFLMCAFYVVSVECSIKKNDVGLRMYRSCVHIVT